MLSTILLVKYIYNTYPYVVKQIYAEHCYISKCNHKELKNMVTCGEKHLGGVGKEALTSQFVSFCPAWERLHISLYHKIGQGPFQYRDFIYSFIKLFNFSLSLSLKN